MERRQFVYTIILGSGGIIASGSKINATTMKKDETMIRMIYNNTGKMGNLKNAWGLSVWIENSEGATLFDTGGKASILGKNMKNLGIELEKLKKVIISHDHWDHTGGLEMVMEETRFTPDLYVVAEIREEYAEKFPSANVIPVSSPQKIDKNLWSTGSLKADYRSGDLYEQAIIVVQDDSMILLTGCSHPGIVHLTERTIGIHPGKRLELVAGGFHLMREPEESVERISTKLRELGVERIAPSHCTGDRSIDIFRKTWGERFVEFNLGNEKVV